MLNRIWVELRHGSCRQKTKTDYYRQAPEGNAGHAPAKGGSLIGGRGYILHRKSDG